jgi:uncharacterized protein YecA (UPF0149 family)
LLDTRQVDFGRTVPTLSGTLGTRIIENPNYSGPTRISNEECPGLHSVDAPLQELELRPGYSATTSPANGTIRRRAHEKVGRNDPCWCGSGIKFKKCHGR